MYTCSHLKSKSYLLNEKFCHGKLALQVCIGILDRADLCRLSCNLANEFSVLFLLVFQCASNLLHVLPESVALCLALCEGLLLVCQFFAQQLLAVLKCL